MTTITAIILLLSCSLSYSAGLICYDCAPTSEENCATPDQDHVKAALCNSNVSETEEYECFSLYYDSGTEDGTGVYRGCVDKPEDIQSTCEYLRERLDGSVTRCATCAENYCNVDDVDGIE